MLKPQQSFRSENHNVFIEEGNKIALSAIIIKECSQLIQWKNIHMEQAKVYYV